MRDWSVDAQRVSPDELGRATTRATIMTSRGGNDAFRLLDIGDIIGVKGFVFRTKLGEVSVHVKS